MKTFCMYKLARFKWLRKKAQAIWVLHPTKSGWLHDFCFPCENTHTFQHYLPKDTPWSLKGEYKGTNSGLVLEGCYLCGKTQVRDWQA